MPSLLLGLVQLLQQWSLEQCTTARISKPRMLQEYHSKSDHGMALMAGPLNKNLLQCFKAYQ
jgi:hypothetical protein